MMFSQHLCKSEFCAKEALYKRDTCHLHLPDPAVYFAEIRQDLLELSVLEYANLSFVPLERIDLSGKTFRFCLFSHSTWKAVCLDEIQMDHVFIDFCSLHDCTFKHSKLLSTVFAGSEIQRSSFVNSDILRCNFIGINCTESEFNESDLYASRFIYARLDRANMVDCNLKRVDFTRAEFSQVDFKFSNIEDATTDQTL